MRCAAGNCQKMAGQQTATLKPGFCLDFSAFITNKKEYTCS